MHTSLCRREDLRRNAMDDVVIRLKELMENEARSCSMDYGCITPLYVYRMLGGQIPLEEIEKGLTEIREQRVFMLNGQGQLMGKDS